MSPPKIFLPLVFSALVAHAAIVAAQTPSDSEAAVTNALTKRVESFFGNLKDPSVNAEDAFADLLEGGPLDGRTEQLKAFVDSYNGSSNNVLDDSGRNPFCIMRFCVLRRAFS